MVKKKGEIGRGRIYRRVKIGELMKVRETKKRTLGEGVELW